MQGIVCVTQILRILSATLNSDNPNLRTEFYPYLFPVCMKANKSSYKVGSNSTTSGDSKS